jgi:uncharacterized protein YdeI (YjbR/CyaY-like superfamily)
MEDILTFESAKEWEDWLADNHPSSKGIWIRHFNKDSNVPSVTNLEALQAALSYGWISGQAKPCDNKSWLAKFVPRRANSIWSKRNTELAEKLIREGRMKSAGMKQIEEAKRDGRWDRAYQSPKNAILPQDFVRELNNNVKAKAFFKTLNKSNRYAIIFRVENAKSPENRRAKINSIIEMLKEGKTFH